MRDFARGQTASGAASQFSTYVSESYSAILRVVRLMIFAFPFNAVLN
jgi:hypothetical protein